MNKKCPNCKLVLDVDEFGIRRTAKDGRKSYCKSCCKRLKKENPSWNGITTAWYREYKEELFCSKCGIKHPAVIDFHHTDEKDNNVAAMVSRGYSKESILAEISKCEVLCSNCHRILHYEKDRFS